MHANRMSRWRARAICTGCILVNAAVFAGAFPLIAWFNSIPNDRGAADQWLPLFFKVQTALIIAMLALMAVVCGMGIRALRVPFLVTIGTIAINLVAWCCVPVIGLAVFLIYNPYVFSLPSAFWAAAGTGASIRSWRHPQPVPETIWTALLGTTAFAVFLSFALLFGKIQALTWNP
jgi:hypothetical protein